MSEAVMASQGAFTTGDYAHSNSLIDQLSERVLELVRDSLAAEGWFQVEASGRHLHISRTDAQALFGSDYNLAVVKPLSQPGQFASDKRVRLSSDAGSLEEVIVLGPEREQTQVEISLTDAVLLGVNPPCRDSGNLECTPGIRVNYGDACVQTEAGLIIAERHIHMKPEAADSLGIKDGDRVDFCLDSPRPVTFRNVKARVSPKAGNFMHIDCDEANAAGFKAGMFGFISRIS
jgi:propanediol utilization protein